MTDRPADQAFVESTVRLLDRARLGDRSALDTLFERCLTRLHRWARGRLPRHARSIADTQDVVQETLLSTFRRLEAFDDHGPGAFQAYLRQAVLNRIVDEVRRAERRRGQAELDSGIPTTDASPLEEAIGSDAVRRYERALAELRPADREAIFLRVELGCPYEEVAESLHKPSVAAARKAVERAIVRLAARMDHPE